MKEIVFFKTADRPEETNLANAFVQSTHAKINIIDSNYSIPIELSNIGLACVVGIRSKVIIDELRKHQIPFLYFDKAYQGMQKGLFWRFSIDSNQPTEYLMRVIFPSERRERFGWKYAGWRRPGRRIIFCGSSTQYHQFHDLPAPHDYARSVFEKIREFYPAAPIVYRVKRGWHFDGEIPEGVIYSPGKVDLLTDLMGARMLITHGSNSCIDALRFGVPSIILGNGVTASISSQTITSDDPYRWPENGTNQLLSNLAWMQADLEEIRHGFIWEVLREFPDFQKLRWIWDR